MEDSKVIENLRKYCYEHGLDFSTLPDILNEPKVVPMVRGIGYEHVVTAYLTKLFDNDSRFKARKTIANPQLTVHGNDTEIVDILKNRTISIECKLAKNGSFKSRTNDVNYPHCRIKIMRSRTLGEEMIKKSGCARRGYNKRIVSAQR
jgi:hypothetical protein